jgi:nitrogen fixation protein FixH
MPSIRKTTRQQRSRLGLCLAAAAVGMLVSAALAQTTQKPTLDITLTSKPSPPKTGDNTLEVTVKDASGKPVTDADVTVNFYMPPMPAMKMPEMKNTVALKHQKAGTYSGSGQVMMAGKWDATVVVKRGGKEIGSKNFPIVAQ